MFGFIAFNCSVAQDNVRVIDGNKFIVHKIEKGHTLYSISKKYNIELADIVNANPQIDKGLKAGEELLIPAGVAEKPMPTINQKERKAVKTAEISHEVQPGETLFSISKKYDVTDKEIIDKNPSAQKGIRAGETLLIPLLVSKQVGYLKAIKDSIDMGRVIIDQTYHIALMLPFYLDINDSILRNKKKQPRRKDI